MGLGKFTPMKEVREKQILQDMRLFVLSLVTRNGDTFLSLGNGSQKWFVNAGVHCCRGLLFFIVFKHFKFFLLQHVCLHDLARVDDVMVTYLRAKNLSFMCVKSRPRKQSRKSSSEICTNNKNKSALHLTVLKTILPDCFVLMDIPSQVVYMECNRKEVKLYQSGKISFTYGCKN